MPLNTAPLGNETREQLRARLATRTTVQVAARKVALANLYAALERIQLQAELLANPNPTH